MVPWRSRTLGHLGNLQGTSPGRCVPAEFMQKKKKKKEKTKQTDAVISSRFMTDQQILHWLEIFAVKM